MKFGHHIFLMLIFLFTSCQSKKQEENLTNSNKKEKLVMYQASEMTKLMREMYLFEEKSKKQITNGELPLSFPEKFLKIHTAKLSSDFERDESFKSFTKAFVTNIENLGTSNKNNAKQNFNTAINTCIACHKTTCTGPIPRIKKLLIK
jgi:cytochrome c553